MTQHDASNNESALNGQSAAGHGPVHPRLGVPGRYVPELAGVCTYEQAARMGLGVEENVALLKRYNWVEQRLSDLSLSKLTATPEWEVKDALSLHVWLDAEHAKSLQQRVAELRHPPHHFDKAPDAALEAWLQEALRSRDTVELLTASYRVLKPALLDAYRAHLETTNPLIDQPTRRLLRFMILEEEEMIAWGQAALDALLTDDAARQRAQAWEAHLRAYLAAAGGIGGSDEKPAAQLPPPRAVAPLEPDFTPRRDARFESHNYHFPPHWVYAQPDRPADERTLALVCKRLLEMDVPEMMASIIWRAREEAQAAGKPKPWEYTVDMCRQIWDEARHSMMGEVWLVNKGVDFTEVPLNTGFSETLNNMVTSLESHAALYAIEQGLMPQNTGKAYEWRTARDSGDKLAQLLMDYDWADEVLHVQIGRWLIEQFGSRKEAQRVGDEAFARVMELRREATQNQQREWWPEFVEKVLGYRPEPLAPEAQAQDAPWVKSA
ncbi:MAG: hypothetical protein M3347_11770 [Armatimonadota bacterium]|nr:hypothetical protein [Armatimonadota bacterium]